jgi:hypothetical protein
MVQPIQIIDSDPTVERQLAQLKPMIGADFGGYRNHIYRVLTYAMHFLGDRPESRRVIAFALVYHDAGMWTDRDLAYLEPSEALAERARRADAPDLESETIRAIIHWHHKVTPFQGPNAEIVNAVRKADWIDASNGVVRHGMTRAQIDAVMRVLPPLGFMDTLMRLASDLNHGQKLGGLWRVLTHVYKL